MTWKSKLKQAPWHAPLTSSASPRRPLSTVVQLFIGSPVHRSQAFPDPSAYSAFMGSFSSATGVATLAMMLFGRFVFRKWGWGTAAMITPAVLRTASRSPGVL